MGLNFQLLIAKSAEVLRGDCYIRKESKLLFSLLFVFCEDARAVSPHTTRALAVERVVRNRTNVQSGNEMSGSLGSSFLPGPKNRCASENTLSPANWKDLDVV